MSHLTLRSPSGAGTGTVTSFSFTDANGFDGTVTNPTTTPNLTLTTTVANTRVMFSNSGAITGDAGLTYNSTTNNLNTGILSLPSSSNTQGYININLSGQDIPVFGIYEAGGGYNAFLGCSPNDASLITGFDNLAIDGGPGALGDITSGIGNVGISGFISLKTGNNNVGILSDDSIISGSNNLIVSGGGNYTSSESNNLLLLNDGVVAESNTTRIGSQGSGDGQQNRCFVAGISGVSLASYEPVVIDPTTGQLATGTAGQTVVSSVVSGSAIALTTATPANLTSISLPIGTWEISALAQFGGAPTVTGAQQASISTTSATHGVLGNNSSEAAWQTANFVISSVPIAIPGYIVTLVAPTTVYLVVSGVFGAGSMTAYGRISATKLN